MASAPGSQVCGSRLVSVSEYGVHVWFRKMAADRCLALLLLPWNFLLTGFFSWMPPFEVDSRQVLWKKGWTLSHPSCSPRLPRCHPSLEWWEGEGPASCSSHHHHHCRQRHWRRAQMTTTFLVSEPWGCGLWLPHRSPLPALRPANRVSSAPLATWDCATEEREKERKYQTDWDIDH